MSPAATPSSWSKDIITEFRGRGYQIHVSPLSFSEFMTTYNGSKEDGWIEYLQYGGLPPVVLQPNDEEKIKFLKDLWQETYLIDILNRNHIKNNAELEELLCMLASGIGGLINPQKLSNTFKTNKNVSISPATLKSYISYCSDAFLIEEAEQIRRQRTKIHRNPYEVLLLRLGIAQCFAQFPPGRENPPHGNAIYSELRRQGFNVDVGVVTVNGKDENGSSYRKQLEVDFVCNKGSRRCYIQSALSLPSQEKIDQEINSLRRLDDGFEQNRHCRWPHELQPRCTMVSSSWASMILWRKNCDATEISSYPLSKSGKITTFRHYDEYKAERGIGIERKLGEGKNGAATFPFTSAF